MMKSLISIIAGVPLSDTSWRRVQLPGPLGGTGVTLPINAADAAFVATWKAVSARVSTVAEELGRPQQTRVDEAHYEAAVQRLTAQGINIDMSGQVGFTPEAMAVYNQGPWPADTATADLFEHLPARTSWHHGQGTNMHSRIMRGLHALEATHIFDSLEDKYDREVMLSSGGQMVGKTWTEIPRRQGQWFDNDHFRMSLQMRLGVVCIPPGAVCQITNQN
eukprot:8947192-Karenia_brevis.AAC.1